jgi:hypothetical protein
MKDLLIIALWAIGSPVILVGIIACAVSYLFMFGVNITRIAIDWAAS